MNRKAEDVRGLDTGTIKCENSAGFIGAWFCKHGYPLYLTNRNEIRNNDIHISDKSCFIGGCIYDTKYRLP
jgi:hypothetical protein